MAKTVDDDVVLQFASGNFKRQVRWSMEFRLTLNGVRDVHLPEDVQEIAFALLTDVEARVNTILAQSNSSSRNVGDLFLGFQMSTETKEAKYKSFLTK